MTAAGLPGTKQGCDLDGLLAALEQRQPVAVPPALAETGLEATAYPAGAGPIEWDEVARTSATRRTGPQVDAVAVDPNATVQQGKRAGPPVSRAPVSSHSWVLGDNCCPDMRVAASQGEPRFFANLYPYASGGRTTGMPTVPGFRINMPETLTPRRVPAGTYTLPASETQVSTAVNGMIERGSTTDVIGRGGSAIARRVTPPAGAARQPYVLKVRFVENGNVESAVRWIERDIAMEGLARQLTAATTYEGRPLVRVANNLGHPNEAMRGIFRQELVEGPSALELQNALDVLSGRMAPTAKFPTHRAEYLLQQSGMTAEEAQNRILALERFYAETHGSVTAFRDRNHLVALSNGVNRADGVRAATGVGFDYNHGRNVAWDANSKMWVMFDW